MTIQAGIGRATNKYEFDPKQHDRFLETEQWEIVLGRGLDFLFVPIATA